MQDKQFRYFDDAHREYVITNPQTPWPWINYLGNEEFFSLISNTAGGYTFYKDAKFRRITRYRYNSVPMDNGGGLRALLRSARHEGRSAEGHPHQPLLAPPAAAALLLYGVVPLKCGY